MRDPSANILNHLNLTNSANILLATLPQALPKGVDAQASGERTNTQATPPIRV